MDANNLWGGYADKGVQDGGSSFVFGLNQGCTAKLEWIENAGKGKTAGEAADIIISKDGGSKNLRLFPVTQAYLKGGGTTTDQNSPEMAAARLNVKRILSEFVAAYVGEDRVAQLLGSTPIRTYKDLVLALKGLLPHGYEDTKIDVFFQYQYKIAEGQKQTFLEVPNNYYTSFGASKGAIFTSAQPGTFKRVEGGALVYSNEDGALHPISRSAYFMGTDNAKKQTSEIDIPEETTTLPPTEDDAPWG